MVGLGNIAICFLYILSFQHAVKTGVIGLVVSSVCGKKILDKLVVMPLGKTVTNQLHSNKFTQHNKSLKCFVFQMNKDKASQFNCSYQNITFRCYF